MGGPRQSSCSWENESGWGGADTVARGTGWGQVSQGRSLLLQALLAVSLSVALSFSCYLHPEMCQAASLLHIYSMIPLLYSALTLFLRWIFGFAPFRSNTFGQLKKKWLPNTINPSDRIKVKLLSCW